MIIRYGGGNAGIAEYLEFGKKVDRHYSRDELDRRIPIDGDLAVTQAVYESINDNGQERYLHITLSFNEPDITEESISDVFQQYKKQLMSAYGDDEFNIYAEIHWPKVKEAYNHNTEQMEPRYPHVHVVIPKKNTLTGKFLNPMGLLDRNVKYFDAIQEKLNRDNGLSSPRNSPRVGSNHYESALGKYKDKEFGSKNGLVKQSIYQEIISRDIRSMASFKELVEEYGDVKIRNEGKKSEYLAVKVSGDEKYTNLKANIFGGSYIQNRDLVIDPISDEQVIRRVNTWRDIQSKEIKHIYNASAKVKHAYKAMALPQRREYLAEREASYEQRYRQATTGSKGRAILPGLPERNYQSGSFEFASGGPAPGTGNLYELRTRDVDHFRPGVSSTDRLLLPNDEENDLQYVQSGGNVGLRRDLYDRGSEGERIGEVVGVVPISSVLSELIAGEKDKSDQKNDLAKFSEIRKKLDPEHLLAYVQIKFGVDPSLHPVSRAKDGSPRIKVGKFNYNVSDFLTKHMGLDWSEASELLTNLYDRQQSGVLDKPKSKVEHIDDWRRFRHEIYPQNIRTYNELKGQIHTSLSLGMKAINAEAMSRRKAITKDQYLTRSDKHYFRSVVILEKLQKIESLQQQIESQNTLKDRVKYPYSTLFYDYATKNEELDMKILKELKSRFRPTDIEEVVNSIGSPRALTPQNMPSGVEAAKRARLVARLHTQERETKELKIKLADLSPRPLPSGAVAFNHKENGQQIFVNHPDRLEMNRVTDPDQVGVGLIFAVERFGSPLEINGTVDFKDQVILVAAERDMDITFTDEAMNKALNAKRIELGLEPLESNSISVQELEIDKSLPLEQAVDNALLASKVVELEAVNEAYVSQQPDVAEGIVVSSLLLENELAHEELNSGFVDESRVEQIAQKDLEHFAYLEGKPQQQDLAVRIGAAMENSQYSAYMDKNGPAELRLTIDAAQVIRAKTPTPELNQPRNELGAQPTAPTPAAPISVATPTAEKSAPILQPVGNPALEAKVASLEAINKSHAAQPTGLAGGVATGIVASSMLSEVETRQEELQSGFVDENRIEEIAEADLVVYNYFDGRPQQQDVAVRIGAGMDNPQYSAYMDKNAPDDLRLTIEASQAIKASNPVQEFTKPAGDLEPQSFASGEPAPSSQPFHPQFIHQGKPAELGLTQIRPIEQTAQLSSKIAELESNRKTHEGKEQSIDSVIRKGLVVDASIRHSDLLPISDSAALSSVAAQDLKAFEALRGTPEQQELALSIGAMMENGHYKSYMSDNAPADLGVTIEAAQVLSEAQSAAPELSRSTDHDLES